MTTWLTYLIISALLLVAELVYFRIADKCNIADFGDDHPGISAITTHLS